MYEATPPELKTKTTAFQAMRTEQKALKTFVNELKSCLCRGHEPRGARDS